MTEFYGADGEAGLVFVDGRLRQAEGHAAAGIGLALRPAVVAP